MILVGIDDTDTIDARGTNQLARAIARAVAARWRCAFVLRHQLLVDPRIPYTSHNGSASLHLEARGPEPPVEALIEEVRRAMRADFIEGSDPGLCVATRVPAGLVGFGGRCRREVVTQGEARALAAREGVHLEGLGGTEAGVIGALAAVGLGAGGDHGRVVVNGDHPDLVGEQNLAAVLSHGVDAVVTSDRGATVASGVVDVGKHLRPNRRGGRTVLFVEPTPRAGRWRAVRRD